MLPFAEPLQGLLGGRERAVQATPEHLHLRADPAGLGGHVAPPCPIRR
jgi:hypothetical protein